MSVRTGSLDPFAALESADRAIFDVLQREETRLRQTLELIASENIASPAVLASMATALSNKYAEGYPGKRYYGGCEHVDEAETLAIERLLKLYGADHANVQPHSGAQANMAAYFAVADPGATLMGMKLSDGGHLTHGHRVSFSGRFFKAVQYGVRKEDSLIDYDALDALVDEHRPQILVAGHSAYPRILNFERFHRAADRVGARLVVDMAHIAGLVATGLHPSPLPHADIVTSTTHKTLRGPRGGLLLCRSELAADVDRTVFPGMQGGPMMHVIAAKAVCFAEALQPSFTAYQEQVLKNAVALATGLMNRGFDLVSGGTENHLVLVDLRSRGITGRVAETALERARITVNKNAIPFDPEKPFVTSGIRLGTPAVTTRGMKEAEMGEIADWITRVLDKPQDETVATTVRAEVERRTGEFPLHASPETFVAGSASG